MLERPLLSIYVAVFNLEKYIKQCLDSILSQSFTDYELLLIDNGSTDGSIAICEEYASKYEKIKYVKFPLPTLMGRPFAYAVNHYNGQYFMTVDGDDYLVEGALQNIADVIMKTPVDLIMGSFVCDIETNMTNFKDAEFDASKINGVPYDEVLEYLTTLPNFHASRWRFITSREVLAPKANGKNLFPEKDEIHSRYNDSISIIAYLLNAKSIVYLPEPFYVYRRRENGLVLSDFMGQHAVDFFKTVISIAKTFETELQDIKKKKYIFQMTEARFELFRELFLDIKEKEYIELCELIEKHRKLLSLLEPLSQHYQQFYQYIKDNEDPKMGLIEYGKAQKKLLMEKIMKCESKRVYVFPSGKCGESLCNTLRQHKINVVSFLDNDVMKKGKMFMNTVCNLPSVLEEVDDIENCCVFIATAYRKNIDSMKQQLVSYGVREENILIR